MASLKKFEIGEKYTCSGLYGGEYTIKVIDRTETTVSFVYDGESSDDSSVQTKEIIVQTRTIFDLNLNELGKRDVESMVAWEYHSQYAAPGENHYGYFFADDGDCLYTPEEWEAENEEKGEDIEVTVIAPTGETRVYQTYAEYKKDFRFFWSSGKAAHYKDGAEDHFEKIIQVLRLMNEDGVKMETHRNGLTSVFTFKRWRKGAK